MQVYVKYISGFDLCNLLLFCRLDYSSTEDEGKHDGKEVSILKFTNACSQCHSSYMVSKIVQFV